jgi:hypothetical protein
VFEILIISKGNNSTQMQHKLRIKRTYTIALILGVLWPGDKVLTLKNVAMDNIVFVITTIKHWSQKILTDRHMMGDK